MSGLYEVGGRGGLAIGAFNWPTDDMRLILLHLASYASSKAITGATNATPIVVTSNGHGFANGDVVSVAYVAGNTAANGKWVIANVAANTFELVGSVGNGAYTSGGFATNLMNDDFLDDVAAGARVAVSGTLANKTAARGIIDADDPTILSVPATSIEGFLIYKHTGVDATARLLYFCDQGAGLPLTTNVGPVVVQFDNGANKILKI